MTKRNRQETFDQDREASKPKFNRYNATQQFKTKPIEDPDETLFNEEKDDLTMLGTDQKAYAPSSTSKTDKPTTTAVSLQKKSTSLNVPLEVLIRPDLRDLYNEEEIQQSLETHVNEMFPSLRPFTFDLAYLINESATLKRFIEMGVDVYRWNQPKDKAKYILTLDFERDCVEHLVFLNELGIKNKSLAEFLSYNPWIFKENLDDLRVRINYLTSKGFSSDDINRISTRAPYLLNLSTKTLETKLNWFVKKFQLTGELTKDFVIRAPKLLTLPLQGISDTYLKMNKELGFTHENLHRIFQLYPKLFIYDYKVIELNFDFLYNEMSLSHSRFIEYPPILKQSFQQLRTRCLYLKFCQRQQFDPTKPNFVSLKDLCLKTNELFCQHVTKTPFKHYLNFVKTL